MLRVGFAGERELDRAQTETLPLRDVFNTIGSRLSETAPMDDATKERPIPTTARFDPGQHPTLRIIHGLCEGEDSIAFEVLEDLVIPPLDKNVPAVVPVPLCDYGRSRDSDFDRQLAACANVVIQVGNYGKHDAPPSDQKSSLGDHQSSISPALLPAARLNLPKRCRARAYRCESALLLRQSDLPLASDPPPS